MQVHERNQLCEVAFSMTTVRGKCPRAAAENKEINTTMHQMHQNVRRSNNEGDYLSEQEVRQ